MTAVRALLSGLIDYAGLFPPAALSMAEAVANFAAYRAGPDAWALARFVVPAGRLDELVVEAAAHLDGEPWRLSALAAPDDAAMIRAFNARHHGRLLVDSVEAKVSSTDELAALAPLSEVAATFVEVPVRDDPEVLVAAIGAREWRAKIRTGGVSPDAFPSAHAVARFLEACARHDVMFKATAGLHHPLRGEYGLTYAVDAPRHAMFGFLNVILAASYVRRGMPVDDVAQLLDERDPHAFAHTADGVTWRGHALGEAALAEDRRQFSLGFGSCSFREPLDDLSALGLT